MKLTYNILSLLLILLLVYGCSKNKIKIEKNIYLLDWVDMPYHNCTTEEIIDQLGRPEKIDSFKIHDSTNLFPIYRPLTRFIPHNSDNVLVKELFWKQDSFQIYYWFIKSRNVWYSRDGLVYDPNHVEF